MAIDLATRTVPAFFIGMERPGAGTVALLVSRIVQPKSARLAHLGLQIDWPMAGLPQRLHLDNAAEFRSRALRPGLRSVRHRDRPRPVGRPNYGGHIERMNRTLMQRLKGLPGATGNSPRGRKARKPEQRACLTLEEFERWLALEVGERYHHSEHRGLFRSTPSRHGRHWLNSVPSPTSAWADGAMKLLINFMPLAHCSIQADGLTIFLHPLLEPRVRRLARTAAGVRCATTPRTCRGSSSALTGATAQANYADPGAPHHAVGAACRRASPQGGACPRVSEEHVFRAIGAQRQIVEQAERSARRARATRSANSGAFA